MSEIALIAATVTTGLIAGLFYTYSCSVMPGLRRADDRTLTTAMREINIAIINGRFFLTFGGSILLITLALVLDVITGGGALPWLVAAFVLYGATLGITQRFNIPLNNALEAARDGDPARARQHFEAAWTRWNNVRTLTNIAAFVCLVLAQ